MKDRLRYLVAAGVVGAALYGCAPSREAPKSPTEVPPSYPTINLSTSLDCTNPDNAGKSEFDVVGRVYEHQLVDIFGKASAAFYLSGQSLAAVVNGPSYNVPGLDFRQVSIEIPTDPSFKGGVKTRVEAVILEEKPLYFGNIGVGLHFECP